MPMNRGMEGEGEEGEGRKGYDNIEEHKSVLHDTYIIKFYKTNIGTDLKVKLSGQSRFLHN